MTFTSGNGVQFLIYKLTGKNNQYQPVSPSSTTADQVDRYNG